MCVAPRWAKDRPTTAEGALEDGRRTQATRHAGTSPDARAKAVESATLLLLPPLLHAAVVAVLQ